MKDIYTPAVFIMALVAIVVAADHDTELEESRLNLEKSIEEGIKRMEQSTEEQVQRLAQLTETHTWANVVMNWTEPTKSYVVVKHWEVPEELLLNSRGTLDLLKVSENLSIETSTKSDDPFIAALRNAYELNKKVNVSALSKGKYLRFLSPAPHRVRSERAHSGVNGVSGLDTRYFFGLLYTMCCIYRVMLFDGDNQLRKDSPYKWPARVRIGASPLWVHVLGTEVYQMVETTNPSRALSRPLHEEIRKFSRDQRGDGNYDSDSYIGMSLGLERWAGGYSKVVQEAYDRGSRAERYIASVLLSCEGEFRPKKPQEGTNEHFPFVFSASNGQTTAFSDLAACLGGEDLGYAFQVMLDVYSGYASQGELERAVQAQANQLGTMASSLNGCLKKLVEEYVTLRRLHLDLRSSIATDMWLNSIFVKDTPQGADKRILDIAKVKNLLLEEVSS